VIVVNVQQGQDGAEVQRVSDCCKCVQQGQDGAEVQGVSDCCERTAR